MKLIRYPLFSLLVAFLISTTDSHGQIITTFAGNGYGSGTGTGAYMGDHGMAIAAELNNPVAVAVDGAGNVYIADRDNNVVRKVNTSGVITTFAGTGVAGYSGNGAAATAAKLNKPYGLVSDAAGNVYISELGNHTVRRVSPAGIINTYVGTGVAGYSGDSSSASLAKLNSPEGLAIDLSGNIYIADGGNNVIRKVTPGDVITTIAGTGVPGVSGDNGSARSAQLHSPAAVAADAFGNIFIADYYNNVVRRVDASGRITTFAGNTIAGYTGDGAAANLAELYFPSGVSVDLYHNIFIADQGNNDIRKVDSTGRISLFAGSRTKGYYGDNGVPTLAQMRSPKGVTADGWGRVFIADYDNNVIRVVKSGTAGVAATAVSSDLRVYPDPSNGTFTVELPAASTATQVNVIDLLGNVVASQQAKGGSVTFTDLSAGNYIVVVNAGDKIFREKIVVIR